MRVLAAYPTADAAYFVASRLESAGIEVEVRDESIVSLNWMYALAVGGVKLAVREEDYDDAVAILSEPEIEPGLLVCPYCGSAEVVVRPLSPAGGVLLATGVPTPFPAQVADCRACGRSHTIAAHPGRAEGGAE